MYRVKYWPDPALKVVTKHVNLGNPDEVEAVCTGLFTAMYAEKGIGLAANQCGLDYRIFVIDTKQLNPQTGIAKAFINPEIIEYDGGLVAYPEGCLSFPNFFINVERYFRVRVKHTLLTGEAEEVILEGLSAVCAQHEIDHLDGKTFIDHLKPVKKDQAIIKIRKGIKKARKAKKS